MKLKLTLFLLFIGLNLTAQTTFKKGTFTHLNGETKTAYIQVYGNKDFEEIIFKDNLETDLLQTIKLNSLLYLEIFGHEKYVRKNVPIEILDEGMFAKQSNNTPEFNTITESHLLRVILDSNSLKLLSYLDKNTNNEYFFIEDNNQIDLIKYKKIRKDNKVQKIKAYRNQLFIDYKEDKKVSIGKTNYTASDFIKYFTNHLKKNDQNYLKRKPASRDFKDAVNVNTSLGTGFFNQDIKNASSNFDTSSSMNLINIGLGTEFFFNDNVKNYSIMLNATYFLKGESEDNFTFRTITSSSEATARNEASLFTLDLKLRKYWQLKKDNYIFANLGIGFNNNSSKTQYVSNNNGTIFADFESANKKPFHYSFGIGYNYKDFLLNLDYYTMLNGEFDSNVTSSTSNVFSYESTLVNISLSYIIF